MKIERCMYAFIILIFLTIEIVVTNKPTQSFEVKIPALSANFDESKEQITESKEINKNIVYENMTMEELSIKLEKSLNSSLKGYGKLFANYTIEKGVDPYLAVAISLHETGCAWNCSKLVKQCNNVGGQKGSQSCNGGAYRSYDTLDEGIKGYIDNLYNGYISKGLNTPETMQRKYTGGSTTWANKVNNYVEKIKNK